MFSYRIILCALLLFWFCVFTLSDTCSILLRILAACCLAVDKWLGELWLAWPYPRGVSLIAVIILILFLAKHRDINVKIQSFEVLVTVVLLFVFIIHNVQSKEIFVCIITT